MSLGYTTGINGMLKSPTFWNDGCPAAPKYIKEHKNCVVCFFCILDNSCAPWFTQSQALHVLVQVFCAAIKQTSLSSSASFLPPCGEILLFLHPLMESLSSFLLPAAFQLLIELYTLFSLSGWCHFIVPCAGAVIVVFCFGPGTILLRARGKLLIKIDVYCFPCSFRLRCLFWSF